jgi:hypothetical protein
MKAFETLAQTKVSRREFLTLAGLAVASIFGIGRVIKLLTGHNVSSYTKRTGLAYNSSNYGAKKLVK